MPVARDWLPEDAIRPDALAAALTPALRGWAAHWFGEATATASGDDRRVASAGSVALSKGQGAAVVTGDARAWRGLAEALLAAPLDPGTLDEADRALLGQAIDVVLGDLLARIGATSADDGTGARAVVTIEVAGARLLLDLTPGVAAGLVRGALTRRPATTPPSPLRSALRTTEVAVEAVLGRGRLTTGELRDMVPGDVILLDRAVSTGADLVLAATRAPIARGKVSGDAERPALRLFQLA